MITKIIPFKQYLSLKGFYLFVIFLFATQATKWTYSFGIKDFAQFLLLVVSSCIVVQKYKISFRSVRLKALLSVLVIWFISHTVFRGIPFEITALINLLFFYLICYIVVNLFKEKLFLWVEDLISRMTYLCVVLYALMLIIGTFNMASLGFMEPADSTSTASFLIFNVPNMNAYDGMGLFGLPRNCGFCWEPGRFACFICVAIVLNMLRTHMQIKRNKPLFLLIVGLFTTFSTTGYVVCMVVIMSFFLFGMSKIKSLFLLMVTIPLCLVILDLPFMKEKIAETSDVENYVTSNVQKMGWIDDGEVFVTPQRFECISLDILNFVDSPIIGYGMNRTYSWVTKKISDRIVLSNGIAKDFAQFGLILALLYNIWLIKNSFRVARIYCNKNRYVILILYYTISVSYPFIMNSLLTPLFLYSLFVSNQNIVLNEK